MGKKILIVSQYFYPENFRINDIALTLKQRGHDVSVLTGLPNYPEGIIYKGYKKAHKALDNYHGIKVYRLKITPRRNNKVSLVLNYLSFVIKGWFFVKKHSIKYDLVFGFEVSPITSVLPAVRYAKKTSSKCVLYLQDIWPEALMMVGAVRSKRVIKWTEKMVKYIYRYQPDILVPSEAYIPWIERLNKELNITYWPQFYEEFYQPQKKSKSESFKADKFRIMFTGNIGTSQGLEQLVDLVAEIRNEISEDNLECVIIGDGRAKKELIQKTDSLNLNTYFRFLGAVAPEEVPLYLAHADLAYLSFKDNDLFRAVIPAKLQSYMACGVPILGLVDGVSADVINEAQGGMVISHKDTNKTEKIMAAIRTNSEDLKIMGQNNLNYAKKHFHKDILIKQFEDMYLNEEDNV
jgi:glycosyltransferase involved in cell wall biosynthesis